MRHMLRTFTLSAALALAAALPAAGQTAGAAPASGPDEPATHLKPNLPPLHLTDAQKQQVRAAVAGKDTEVTFQLKGAKPHKNFTPSVGAKNPPQLPAHALPSELTQKTAAAGRLQIHEDQGPGADRQSDDRQDRRHVSGDVRTEK